MREIDNQRCGSPILPFGVVVIAPRLRDQFVLRLLQGHATIGGLGQVAGSQAMRGKCLRVEAGLPAACLHDQIDRLRRQGATIDIAPLVDPEKDRSVLNLCLRDPLF